MSMHNNFYVIAGYDLYSHKTEKYEEWRWEEEGEKYLSYQRKGKIQLFDDLADDLHFYLGYIIAVGNEYEFNEVSMNISEISKHKEDVDKILKKLQDIGVIKKDVSETFKLITFVEAV